MIMAVRIIVSGPLSTIQDKGRYGYLKAGIGWSGVMDMEAYKAANYLVGNENDEAVIETTLMGPAIYFEDECIFAITGADMKPTLDGISVENYRALRAMKGQTLTMQMAVNGCRGYIAFAGGIDVCPVMGSRSTNIKCHIGGYEGRPLKSGDVLKTGISYSDEEEILKRSLKKVTYDTDVRLRVIEGPQEEYFTDEGKKNFYNSTYTILPESDRMGFRLSGPSVDSVSGVDIVSDGIAFGAIQIPPSGKPIILLADRQTTGGYAKLATVCSADLSKLVQLMPGNTIRFEKITIEEAQKIKR